MKKHQKNHFWYIALFTRFNLVLVGKLVALLKQNHSTFYTLSEMNVMRTAQLNVTLKFQKS